MKPKDFFVKICRLAGRGTKMPGIFLPFIMLVTGCASGVSPGVLAPGASGDSRLIIYRPSNFFASLGNPTVKINGVASCRITDGGGFQKEIGAGAVTLSMGLFATIGTSSFSFNAVAGQVYYVKVTSDEGESIAAKTGGLLGESIEQMTSKHSGPFDIALTDQASMKGISPGICNI